MKRNEGLLQYIWKFQLFSTPLKDPQGNPLEVIDPGQHNADSGPDFFNARIKSGLVTWAGNVEIHSQASDWYTHGHHYDPAYDNVILHAVVENNRKVLNSKGREILTVSMDLNQEFQSKLKNLLAQQITLPSSGELLFKTRDWLYLWMEDLYMERLEERIHAVKMSLEQTGGDWEEVLYRALGRAMGQKANAEPFDMLTRSISLGKIHRYCPDLHSKESILFGQAGMLDNTKGDAYFLGMKQSYEILRQRLDLQPMDAYLWKYLRLRPMNFPDIRIAQFAWLLDKYPALFSQLLHLSDPGDFIIRMILSTSGYWTTHSRLNKPGHLGEKIAGRERLSGLLINAVVPVLCSYMRQESKSVRLLEISHIPAQLPVENNRVIRIWKSLGIPVRDGFSSQAVLQLTKKLGFLD